MPQNCCEELRGDALSAVIFSPPLPASGTAINMPGFPLSIAVSSAPASGEMLSTALQYFQRGGPIMYPIVVVSIVALTVVLERIFWWSREGARKRTETLHRIYDAVQAGDLEKASSLAGDSTDPRVRVVYQGLNHQHESMQGALQLAAAVELQRASRFLPVMDTIITLAPLLGLLGTVTGIMGAFNAVHGELNVDAVSGGIGEALIATACGLAIAMFALIPYNFFSSKVEFLKFELETAATNLEVMMRTIGEKRTPVAASRTAQLSPAGVV
jgi:biopolymer transport protein ExbB